MTNNKKEKIIIIGGISAGTSAAAKIRRKNEDLEVVIYEKDKYISYATCGLPYYISGKIRNLSNLIINTAEGFERRFNIKIKKLHKVLEINPLSKTILVENLKSGAKFTDSFDKLIITTGSLPIKLDQNISEYENIFVLKTIDDGVNIKKYIEKLEKDISSGSLNHIKDKKRENIDNTGISDKRVNITIIGGGFIGLELLEAFLEKGFRVTILEKKDQVLPMFDREITEYAENYILDKGIEIIKGDQLKEVVKDENNLIKTIKTLKGKEIETNMVFLGIGTRPNTELAKKCGIKLGKTGAIAADEYMRTNFKDIYAAGDCCECKNLITGEGKIYYLASIASRQGRVAGYNAAGGDKKFFGSSAASIIKILDIAIAKVGISFKEAREYKVDVGKIELHYPSHAGYYPGAEMIHMLMVFDKKTGKILGFQAIGKSGVDKKVDILSSAIKSKLKVWDLLDFDMCYQPAYGSAKDPVNILGMIGENLYKKEVELIDVEELKRKMKNRENIIILDVRTKSEYEEGHIEGSILIPIDSLRDNVNRLGKNDEIILYCERGYRSYLGCRTLKNLGFKKVKNLNGSYLSWERKI